MACERVENASTGVGAGSHVGLSAYAAGIVAEAGSAARPAEAGAAEPAAGYVATDVAATGCAVAADSAERPEATIALLVSYDGAPFHGFARQPGGLATVQGSLEDALALLYRRPVETTCAGRTDAGVHALGQVVSYNVSEAEKEARPVRSLLRALNALTPEEVAVRQVAYAPAGFSARFDARSRYYRYFISDSAVPPLVMRRFCWQLKGSGALDVDAMNEGARYLIGEHDFKSFCLASSAVGKPTSRNVLRLDVERVDVMGQGLVCINVVGSSFLHSMVRTIAGTLVAVGRGLREPAWVGDVLAACNREAAGEKAPAQGLVFWSVDYGGALKF